MKRIAVLMVAMLTMGSLIIIVPNHVTAVNERKWIPLNQDINVGSGYPGLNGYIRVNVSDVLYINWTSGTILFGQGPMDITVYPSTPIINCSDTFSGFGSEIGGGGAYKLSYAYGQSSPQSAWLRVGSYDILDIWTIVSTNSVQTLNFSVQREIPDIYAMNNSIANLTTNLNLVNVTITTNLSCLWKSYLENISYLDNKINWTYIDIMYNVNNVREGLNYMDGLILDYILMLNASYMENLSLIQAYMNFTNASINYLNAELTLLNQNETYDIASLIDNLNDLHNYTDKANNILSGFINMTDSNSSARDIMLNNSIRELQKMTVNLTDKDNFQDVNNVYAIEVLGNSFNHKINDLNYMITNLTNWNEANTTKLNKQITDVKNQAYTNTLIAGIIGVALGAIITVITIVVYNKRLKKHMGTGTR
jgi:hypothetical protein